MTSAAHGGERSFDRILARLSGVRRTGPTQASAMCPAHGNTKTQALSVTYFPAERLTKLKCHSVDCSARDILAALDLEPWAAHDDPPQPCEICGKLTIPDEAGHYIHDHCAARRDGKPAPAKPPAKPKAQRLPRLPTPIAAPAERASKVVGRRQEVARYEHVDDNGEVVAISVRSEQLRQVDGDREPTRVKTVLPTYADGKGGWGRKQPGQFVPVWRLHEVRDAIAAGEPVWWCEGHKAAQAVIDAGGVASTVLLGELHAEEAQALRGGHVRIIPDLDAVGFEKALKAAAALEGLAASITFWLPATTGAGDDAYDHLQAGYVLAQLIPADRGRIEVMKTLAIAAGGAAGNNKLPHDLDECQREASAWLSRVEDADDDAAAEEARSNAQRWAAAAGHRLRTLVQLRSQLQAMPAARQVDLGRMAAIIEDTLPAVTHLYRTTGAVPDDDLVELIHLDEDPPGEPDDGSDAAVFTLPVRIEPGPRFPIDMPGEWRYDDGTGMPRGVYYASRSQPWRRIAPLPFVLARIVRRDGRSRRIATDYLLATTPDGTGEVVNRDELGDGRWASRLGLPLSHDPKVRQAAASAIEAHAAATAPEKEQITRINPDSGKLDLPAEAGEQYFECAPGLSRSDALEVWRQIITEASQAPRLAHLIGASAIAPFLSSITDSLAHWVSVTGAAQRGKTVGLKVAAAVWGNAVAKTASGTLMGSWSASNQAIPQMLGELGIMPTFLDDAGAAGYTKAEWAKLIYRVSAGAARKRTNVREGRIQIDKSWFSILFTNANDHLTSGIDVGAFQGVIRRVIEIPSPVTTSSEQAKRLVFESIEYDGLVNRAYGHLGMQIVDKVTVGMAAEYLAAAEKLLPEPAGDVSEVARILQVHLAGAIMIDQILGTGQLLTLAALESIADTLDEWLPGESEADRLLALIRESLLSDPAAWPSQDEYHDAFLANAYGQERVSDRHKLLQVGLYGLRCPDGGIAVLPRVWHQFAKAAEINTDQAFREMELSGVLVRNRSAKNRTQTWQTRVRWGRGVSAAATWCYKVILPDVDDYDPAEREPASPADVPGSEPPVFQDVLGPVLGDNPPVTRDVLGVLGVPEKGTHDVSAQAHGGAHERVHAQETSETTLVATAEEVGMVDPVKWLDRSGLVGWAQSLEQRGTCLVCERPCTMAIGDYTIHPPCWQKTTAQERARLATERDPAVEAWTRMEQPWPPCVVCGEPASQALRGVPLHALECFDAFQSRRRQPASTASAATSEPERIATAAAVRGERFVADSVVLGANDGWLSSGALVQRPQIRHAGDLASWAAAMRLGFGGTVHHRPEPGRIWIEPDLCAELGLPADIGNVMEVAEPQLVAMRQGPFWQDAIADGWQIVGAEDKPWIKIYRGPQSAIITSRGWGVDRYDRLLGDNPDSEQLAARLGLLCRTIDYPYTVTPAITGVNAMEYSLKDGLPAVPVPDVPYNDIAALPSWINAAAIEAADPDDWVHVFDRRKSYLAGAGNALVGDGAFVHHPNGCERDPKTPGFYRIQALEPSAQPLPFLECFDVLDPGGVRGSGWVSSAMMGLLEQLQAPVTILEAVTWPIGGTRLKKWQDRERRAGETLEQLRSQGDPTATALLNNGVFKGTYADAIGALVLGQDAGPLEPRRRYRPHWRAEILGAHTTNTLRAVKRLWDASGAVPLAIGLTDAVAYIGPSTDPGDAWPGQGSDSLTNPALGKFKPAGYIRVAEWRQAILANQSANRPVSLIRLVLKHGHQW